MPMNQHRKLTFSTLACPDWNLRQIVDAAVAAGCRGIDFRGIGKEIDITRTSLFDAELDSTLAILRSANLEVPCLNTSVGLVCPTPERWEMMLDECHRYARIAGRMNTPFLRIFGGGLQKGMTRPEALNMAQRHLRQLIKLCKPFNCQIVVETHDDWSTSSDILELLHEFDPGEAGVLWDIEHPFHHGESPADTAAGMHRFVKHVHVKDSVEKEGKLVPRLLGEGTLPLHDFFNALDAMKYDGWVCLECEKRWHPQEAPEPEVSLPQFVNYLRGMEVG
jgi:sugar phosphate isomerase/epimerase